MGESFRLIQHLGGGVLVEVEVPADRGGPDGVEIRDVFLDSGLRFPLDWAYRFRCGLECGKWSDGRDEFCTTTTSGAPQVDVEVDDA